MDAKKIAINIRAEWEAEYKLIAERTIRALSEVEKLQAQFLKIDPDLKRLVLFGSLAEGFIVAAAHSTDYSAVCFIQSERPILLGVDIEKIDPDNVPNDQRFSKGELSVISAMEADYRYGTDSQSARIVILSAKESLAKALNTPFAEVMRNVIVVEATSDSLILVRESRRFYVSWYLMGEYAVTYYIEDVES